MRDPKTHAKVLATRRRAASRASKKTHWHTPRWNRLLKLKRHIKAAQARHRLETEWAYEWTTAGQGLWVHGTKIIRDTEEEAP